MGTSFIDYIIADPFIAPMEHQRWFDEKIVHLPDVKERLPDPLAV